MLRGRWRGQTFELRGRGRQDARPARFSIDHGTARAGHPAVGAPLQRRVKRRRFAPTMHSRHAWPEPRLPVAESGHRLANGCSENGYKKSTRHAGSSPVGLGRSGPFTRPAAGFEPRGHRTGTVSTVLNPHENPPCCARPSPRATLPPSGEGDSRPATDKR